MDVTRLRRRSWGRTGRVPAVDPGLVYDIGMHRGFDTEFYLRKGFRVVAVEANPALVAESAERLATWLEAGSLVIVDKAIANSADDAVDFHVNLEEPTWSSLDLPIAARLGHRVETVRVPGVTLADLFAEHGVPYYLKCDVEAFDLAVARQLGALPVTPPYASFEASDAEIFEALFSAGYDRFQLINIAVIWSMKPPDPPLEGEYADAQFHGEMTGLFGRELPVEGWQSLTEAIRSYVMWNEAVRVNQSLVPGWLDVHVTRRELLSPA